MILVSNNKNIISILIFFSFIVSCDTESKSYDLSGPTFGTYYKIKYYSNKTTNSLKQSEIDSIFENFNNSFSTYLSSSIISKINSGQNIKLDNLFQDMFFKSKILYNQTDGMFDPSIGLLLDYYGFGPDKKSKTIKNFNLIMESVGYNKLDIVDNRLVKQNIFTKLDFNAIAKGYAVDVIAELLNNKLIDNYLIDQHRNKSLWFRNDNWEWELRLKNYEKSDANLNVALTQKEEFSDFTLTEIQEISDSINKYILIGKGI